MNTHEILKAARAKIALPENWTQGDDARDKDGMYVTPQSPKAVQWCALGAFLTVTADGKLVNKAADALRYVIGGPITTFNDLPGRKHEEVLAVFDRAIAVTANANSV